MRLAALLTWLVGAGILAGLIATNHADRLLAAVERLHWWLIAILLYHAVPLTFDVLGWRRLFVRPPNFLSLVRIRWIGEAVNGLLPVPHLGEILRAKLPHDEGSDLTDSTTSVIGDVTIGLATQVVFVAVGLAYLAAESGRGTLVRSLATIAVLAFFGASFYWAQTTRWFSRTLAAAGRLLGRSWTFDFSPVRRVEDALRRLYGRRGAVAAAFWWRLLSWFAGAGEVWLIAYLLGRPIGWGDAIALESLSQGARAVAFVIPGGLGVQDGTLMVLAANLGLGGGLGLVISLVKRFREVAIGLPALAVAYSGELRRWRALRAQAGGTWLSMPATFGMIRGRRRRES